MFYDRFEALCINKGISKKRAAEEIGLSNSVTTKWKKTGAMPSTRTLQRISEYFGVSMQYLLGEEKEAVSEDNGPYSAEDIELLRLFREADESKKEAIMTLLGLK